jgi:hypothetical protein
VTSFQAEIKHRPSEESAVQSVESIWHHGDLWMICSEQEDIGVGNRLAGNGNREDRLRSLKEWSREGIFATHPPGTLAQEYQKPRLSRSVRLKRIAGTRGRRGLKGYSEDRGGRRWWCGCHFTSVEWPILRERR